MGCQGVKPSTPLAELREVCVAGPYNTRCAGAVGAAATVCKVRRLPPASCTLKYHYYCFNVLPFMFYSFVMQLYMKTLLMFK